MAITDALTYAKWKLEGSTYKTTAETNWKSFGHGVKLTTFNANNNMKYIYGINNQEAAAAVGGAFMGTGSVDFVLADPWILSALTGNSPTTTGAGPYTHKFLDTSAAPTLAKTVKSFTVEAGADLTTDLVRTMSGCVPTSFKLNATQGSEIKCSLDFDYATEALTTTYGTNVTSTDAPYTFAYGTLEIPVSTTIARVESVDVTITRNAEVKHSLGSRLGSHYLTKLSEYTINVTVPLEDASLLDDFYGLDAGTTPQAIMAEIATLRLVFNNAAATTANRQVDLKFSNLSINEFGTPFNEGEQINQILSLNARTWTLCQAINNQSTQPA